MAACKIRRLVLLLMGLMVRHTPAFGHPSPRGDARKRVGMPVRFGVAADYDMYCVAIPSRRGEKELPVAVPIAKR